MMITMVYQVTTDPAGTQHDTLTPYRYRYLVPESTKAYKP